MSDLVAIKAQLMEIATDMANKINLAGGGGGIVLSKSVESKTPRWLRFDPTNRKGLVIKGGTIIKKENGAYAIYNNDTHVDLTTSLTTAGAEYFVNLANDGTIVASTQKLASGVTIGRLHTLCVNVGNITMIAPASPSSGIEVGDNFLVKAYSASEDSDFYNFYNKEVRAVSVGSPYDVITCYHPLRNFEAGDILPESVFCLTWRTDCLTEDAMVYDKDTGRAIDVYLQSGTGANTRSVYNATHIVSRQQGNHAADMHAVGKRLLSDDEFTSAALGSNETTAIKGATDAGTVGGHKDTADRRMISAIGCEEMCGYLNQWTETIGGYTGNSWGNRDGKGSFGQEYGDPYVLLAGGNWANSASCGSRCRLSHLVRSAPDGYVGGRGSSRVIRGF